MGGPEASTCFPTDSKAASPQRHRGCYDFQQQWVEGIRVWWVTQHASFINIATWLPLFISHGYVLIRSQRFQSGRDDAHPNFYIKGRECWNN